ncbi:MAG: AzlC family ABC transporter permease [Gordonia sp. (in: high G+C Gram-positive bacteria)]|uniref:AzlC family ABC transporter permease n=1 Tax=Gordonia TaxID=2053 RepID=UPI003267A7E4
MSSSTHPAVAAARVSGVVWLGLFALGIGFGVLCRTTGLDWWVAPTMSTVIFAGSVEFILAGMFAVATPLAAVAVTTLLVNSRHVFYGLSFPLQRVEGRLGKFYSVYALCDEAYALCTSPDAADWSSSQIRWTQFGLQFSWAGGALVGSVAGPAVLGGLSGLGFVLTALFIALSIDAVDANRDVGTVVLAIGSGVVAHLVAPGAMLIVAMILFTVTVLIRYLVSGRGRLGPETQVPTDA